jgi:3-dehydroquinate dehydratase / shikimate dehydrogenase
MNHNAKICVPVCVKTAGELREAIERGAALADIVELRVDCLSQSDRSVIRSILSEYGARVSLITTMRANDQGGHNSLDYQSRQDFWNSLENVTDDCLIDLELDLATDFATHETRGLPRLDWDRVICSHHDFNGVPNDLEQIYARMANTPAGILKIAIHAGDATDCLPVFRLLERAQREGRKMIAIAMGQAGLMTRVLGPSRGSFLTYGSFDDDTATAPGQIAACDLRRLYRIDQLDGQTEIFGIIGKPIGHSLSPHIQNAALSEAQSNAVYLPFEVRDVSKFLQRMVHPNTREIDWNLKGLSVTAPHKSAVMDSLDWVEPRAKEIGAVNTIVIHNDQLHGYNTDADGFVFPLRQRFPTLQDARCAIIGAGGAARAAAWALQNEGASIEVFVRNPRNRYLFDVECHPLAGATFADFDIVINTSPLGTRGDDEDETPALAAQLRGMQLAYDLVYNPLETRFLREAQAAGCETMSGLEMLLSQAVKQFNLWTATEPNYEVMRVAAFTTLAK